MDEQKFFDLIERLPNRETKIRVLLLFLEEIGGMINHLDAVGLSWGANGEENRAYTEKIRYVRIAQRIKDAIITEAAHSFMMTI